MYKALPPANTWPWPWEQPLNVAEQKTDLSLDKSLSQHSCQQRGVATYDGHGKFALECDRHKRRPQNLWLFSLSDG